MQYDAREPTVVLHSRCGTLKLLFVLPEYPPEWGGGISVYYGALLPALVKRGHKVCTLVGSAVTNGGEPYEHEGVSVERLETGRAERLMPAFSRYAALPELQRHLSAARALWEQAGGGEGYDAVEVVDWGLLFAPWASEPGPPAIVQLHGSSGQISEYDTVPGAELLGQTLRLLEAGLLVSADALHTYSAANGAFWEKQTGRPVTVSPPPLPPAKVLNTPREPTGFVAARVQEWKGPQVLAAALQRLDCKAPVVEWAGRVVPHPETGEPYDARLARDFPSVWMQTLRPLGALPPAEVRRRQAAAAFVVVPSLWDVYNLSVAEAMQQQAVVVCSDGAGGADLVEDGRNGFVVPAGDAEALAGAIQRAAGLPTAERDRMGRAARETAVSSLDPDLVAAAAEARYANLEATQRPRPALPPWLQAAAGPGTPADRDEFFRHLPLRSLLAHAARRLREKVPGPLVRA